MDDVSTDISIDVIKCIRIGTGTCMYTCECTCISWRSCNHLQLVQPACTEKPWQYLDCRRSTSLIGAEICLSFHPPITVH